VDELLSHYTHQASLYGEGLTNSHRHAPDGWLPASVKISLKSCMDVNQRDFSGYSPVHHAAARGDTDVDCISSAKALT
jgi:hypothetical protein